MVLYLTQKLSEELEGFLGSSTLEGMVIPIYRSGPPRRLYGRNSLMVRTLGENFLGPDSFEEFYYDDFKGIRRQTEFAEFMESVKNYDLERSNDQKTDMILEAADILFQSIALDVWHNSRERYIEARKTLDGVLDYVRGTLHQRGVPLSAAKKIAQIKYGIRVWMLSKGFSPKNPQFEKRRCTRELEKMGYL